MLGKLHTDEIDPVLPNLPHKDGTMKCWQTFLHPDNDDRCNVDVDISVMVHSLFFTVYIQNDACNVTWTAK